MKTNARATAGAAFQFLLLVLTATSSPGGGLTAPGAQPTRGGVDYVDVDRHTAEGAAIASLVRQGVLRARTATEFKPQEPLKRGELAIALQKLLNPPPVPKTAEAVGFPDIQLGTPLEEAVRAVAPYWNRQILCFGCALGSNFLPEQTPSRSEVAVLLVSILLAQHRVQLVGDAERDRLLSSGRGASDLVPLARTYVATALKYRLVTLGPANDADLASPIRRGEFAVQLYDIQQRLHLEHQPAAR